MAVVEQPQAGLSVSNTGDVDGAPPGLGYLTQIDQLISKQVFSPWEALGHEAANKYKVVNSVNQQVYYVVEESDICMRQLVGPNRGFILHVLDNFKEEVMRIERPFKCCGGCCWCSDGCCYYPIFVRDKLGNPIGTVCRKDSKCSPHFGIYDENEEQLYDIWGPCCPCQAPCGCTADIDFPIRNVKDDEITAKISKVWAGALKEMLTDADTFCLSFPLHLDAKHKALMLACIYAVDFFIFEKPKNNH